MADPEQIYTEVLQEEQGKGVSPAVAEGRAKAARVRAEQGSPHPKEPKWWPGAQPHLEGDGAAPAEPAAEAPAEEAPAEAEAEPAAEEAPAAEAPAPAAAEAAPAAPEPAPAAPAAEQPAAPAAEQPAAPAAEQPAAPAPAAAQPAPAAAPSQPPDRRGVTHGVPTGSRLRPEDEVQTDAQFEGQQAVYERRRLIDEVVATQGPPPAPAGPRSGQWALFLVYLAVVAGAIFFVVGQNESIEGGGESEAPPPGGGGPAVTAQNVAFDTETLELPAGEETQLEFHNEDAPSVPHNIAIYEDDSASNALFQGETIPGGQSITYEIPSLEQGSYYFQCDVHPGMSGEVTVQ